MALIKKKRWGFQGRKKHAWWIEKKYNSIDVRGYYYSRYGNFVVSHEEENRRLYNAQPCMSTDQRYSFDTDLCHPTHIFWTRFKNQPLKKLVRIAKSIRNAEGVTFRIESSYYIKGAKLDYHVKGSKLKFDPEYKIDLPRYTRNFTNGGWAQELTDRLRQEGFIVGVSQNYDRLNAMIDTVRAASGKPPIEREPEKFQIATAYGFGKQIGFSEGDNDFCGYWLGEENVLFDCCGYFDKWSRCETISKDTPLDKIIDILKKPYDYGD